jgi:hypothetical protein
VSGTPFDLDMLTAIACQETGYIWDTLRRKGVPVKDILMLCTGDTLDAPNRSAFPKTRAELLAAKNGPAMFAVARAALTAMAAHIKSYQKAAANTAKFCHGFGVFQYDLQHFKKDPDYFLQRRWADFGACLEKCLTELRAAQQAAGYGGRASLSDLEMAHVCIAYNAGSFKPARGLRQGHEANGKFYGELLFDFLRLARTVAVPGAAPSIAPPPPGEAIVPPPTPVASKGPSFLVDTQTTTLRVRRTPEIPADDPSGNVVAELPDGHPVRAITGKPVKGFIAIETNLGGAHIAGFCAAKFLRPMDIPAIIASQPEAPALASQIPPAHMPRKPGHTTRRRDTASAHSLNEAGQPGRKGETAEQLRAELHAIIAWLAVDAPAHARFQPRDGLTFCNIYAHDYCHLAGAYLPRVWWTEKALLSWAQGQQVPPLIGDTVREMRANDLFRWLRDFGPHYGWRQTGTLTKLQTAANQGALGVICARRKEDGRSGHIVMTVPETAEHKAKRDAAGDVTCALQSQAGVRNFQYGTSKQDWFKDPQFAEFGFWIHA